MQWNSHEISRKPVIFFVGTIICSFIVRYLRSSYSASFSQRDDGQTVDKNNAYTWHRLHCTSLLTSYTVVSIYKTHSQSASIKKWHLYPLHKLMIICRRNVKTINTPTKCIRYLQCYICRNVEYNVQYYFKVSTTYPNNG